MSKRKSPKKKLSKRKSRTSRKSHTSSIKKKSRSKLSKSSHRKSPTRITVTTMAGVKYNFFANGTDTYGDIKNVLHRQFIDKPKPLLRQLVLVDSNDNVVNDMTRIPSIKVVTLDVLIDEPTWTRDQQYIIRDIFDDYKKFMYVDNRDLNSPDKMEAFVWGMQRNTSIKKLWVENTSIIPIMNALHENLNKTIEELAIININNHNDEISEFFEMIGENTFLKKLFIERIHFTNRMMNALVQSIRVNTSLREIEITKCNIVTEDIKKLISSLDNQHTLQKLTFSDIKISGPGSRSIRPFLLRRHSRANIEGYMIYDWIWWQDDEWQDDEWLEEQERR